MVVLWSMCIIATWLYHFKMWPGIFNFPRHHLLILIRRGFSTSTKVLSFHLGHLIFDVGAATLFWRFSTRQISAHPTVVMVNCRDGGIDFAIATITFNCRRATAAFRVIYFIIFRFTNVLQGQRQQIQSKFTL